MNHLIIYAHPSENSFSYKLKDALTLKSNELAWDVTVRDLYQMNYDPVLRAEDLSQLKKGVTPPDIAVEQELLMKADLISIIYPLWWASFPAILKGYIDKVLAYGFAYEMTAQGIEGKLKNKKVLLFTSMGNSLEQYEQKNLISAFKQIQGDEVFEFCGMSVLNHTFFPQIPESSTHEIQTLLDSTITEFSDLTF